MNKILTEKSIIMRVDIIGGGSQISPQSISTHAKYRSSLLNDTEI